MLDGALFGGVTAGRCDEFDEALTGVEIAGRFDELLMVWLLIEL